MSDTTKSTNDVIAISKTSRVAKRSRGPAAIVAVVSLTAAFLMLTSGSASASTAGGIRNAKFQPSCSTTVSGTYGSAPVELQIATAGKTACLTFTASAGDAVVSDIVVTSGSISIFEDVFNADGTSVCAGPYSEPGACTLSVAGKTTIEVSDSGGTHTGTLNIAIQRLNQAEGCKSISFGTGVVKDKITTAGELTCYTFSANSGGVVYGRGTPTKGSITSATFLLGSPNGSEPCDGPEGGGIDCTLSDSGTQSLLIYSGSETGSVDLALQQLNAPVGCSTLTKNGPAVAGDIAKKGQVLCFTFKGKDGKQITGTVSNVTGTFRPFMDLFDPSGTSVLAGPGTSITDTPNVTGTWMFLIYDSSGLGLGTFDIKLT